MRQQPPSPLSPGGVLAGENSEHEKGRGNRYYRINLRKKRYSDSA
jgi:hypothetical protein